jgi:hypothetical protein
VRLSFNVSAIDVRGVQEQGCLALYNLSLHAENLARLRECRVLDGVSARMVLDSAIDRHENCQKIQDRGRDVLRKLACS